MYSLNVPSDEYNAPVSAQPVMPILFYDVACSSQRVQAAMSVVGRCGNLANSLRLGSQFPVSGGEIGQQVPGADEHRWERSPNVRMNLESYKARVPKTHSH